MRGENKKAPRLSAGTFKEYGAGEEIRTLDPLVGNEMLYH